MAERVLRIMDTSRVLSTRIGRGTFSVVCAVGLAATLLVAFLGVTQTIVAGADPQAGAVSSTESTADANVLHVRGRVLDHLSQAIGGPDHLDVYVCGHPEMVAEARRRLAEAGIDEDSVVYEKY